MRKSVFSHADKINTIYGVSLFPRGSEDWNQAFEYLLREDPKMSSMLWCQTSDIAVVRGVGIAKVWAISAFQGIVRNVFSPVGILFSHVAWPTSLPGYAIQSNPFLTQEERVRHALTLLQVRRRLPPHSQKDAGELLVDARRFLRLLLDGPKDPSLKTLFARWSDVLEGCGVRDLLREDAELANTMALSTMDLAPITVNH